MVKKILFVMLVAIATFATSSCSKDDPSAIETYTTAYDLKFEKLSEAQKESLQWLVDMIPAPQTKQITLDILEKAVNASMESFKAAFDKMAPDLKDDQKVTLTINVYKGSTTSGTPIYSKSVTATKEGAVVK